MKIQRVYKGKYGPGPLLVANLIGFAIDAYYFYRRRR
jgi:hypothetical protein